MRIYELSPASHEMRTLFGRKFFDRVAEHGARHDGGVLF
jgi:hypothetical protein